MVDQPWEPAVPKFSSRSLKARAELHPLLQKLADEAIKTFDFVIVDASRNRAQQEAAVAGGFSKVHFGNSAHNWKPAVAMDLYPFPIPKNMDTKAYRAQLRKLQIEVIKPAAARLGIPIRQGIDFNRDGNLTNDKFVDLPHVELHPWRDFAKQSKPIED